MAVSLVGDLITHTGVGDDASIKTELLSIPGVTSIPESAGCTRLIVPYRFQPAGTLTTTSLTAFTFTRAGTPANEVVITGRWNYKESRTVNGLTDWKIMPPMIFTQAKNSGFNGQGANIVYVNGGIKDFAKIELRGNGGHYWNGGTIILRDVLYNAEGNDLVNDNQITTQSGNPTLDIDGLEYRGTSLFLQNYISINLKRLQPKFAIRGFGSGFGLTKVLEDYDGKGTGFDLSIYAGGQNSLIIANNPVKGGGITCGPWNSPNNNNNEYQATADLQLVGVNDVGAAVLFKAYHLDNNAGAPVGAGKTGTNYTLRKAYNVLSTVGGVATIKMLLSAGLNDNSMVRRSAVQTNDLYIFKCFSYLSQPTETGIIDLSGAGGKIEKFTQLRDLSISQSVKATVDAYTTIDNPDQLYDRAKSFLFDNFAGESATLLAASGTALSAQNVIVDATATAAFAYNSGTNTITIKSSSFSAGVKFKSLTIAGTFTLLNGAVMANLTVTGNAVQATPSNLSNVTITGSLTYSTAVVTPVTFTSTTTGTVSNSGTAVIPIKRINSTLIAGTNVTSYVPTTLVFSLSGGRIRVLDNVGVQQFSQTIDGTFELPAAATGTWTYRIAKYGQKLIESSVVIDGTTKPITASYIPDTAVVETEANAAAYTDLQTTQKIYDYLSYYGTTAVGIVAGSVASKGFGTLTVPAGLTLDPAAAALVTVASGAVKAKTSGLAESVVVISAGNVTQGTATLSNDVKLRALNLDSEIVYTVDTVKFYPTQTDRDAGTNPGVSSAGGVYRFKLGATITGVPLTGTIYLRLTVGAVVFFAQITLVAGQNTLDLGVQSQLTSISQRLLSLPQIEASQVLATKADVWAAAN